MKLTKQEQKVYNYIRDHLGCTTKDIQRDLGIECPSARITYMRQKGVDIRSIGQKKFPGSRPFEMYAIDGSTRAPKKQQVEFLSDGSVRVSYRYQFTS